MLVPMDRHAPPRRVGPPQPLEGEYILAFSPDGRELFLGDRKGRISVIDIETGSIQLGPDLDDWAHWQRLAP